LSSYRKERVSIEKSRQRRVIPPDTEDFHRAHDDLDWNHFVRMRQAVRELRNHYSTMHDVITKNWQLINNPRSDDTMPLVY